MDEQSNSKQEAERVYADVRALLDRLPENHPATPLIAQAVALADVYRKKVDPNGGASTEAGQARPHVGPDARDASE